LRAETEGIREALNGFDLIQDRFYRGIASLLSFISKDSKFIKIYSNKDRVNHD